MPKKDGKHKEGDQKPVDNTPDGGGDPPEKTFTQEDFDAVAAKERKRGIDKGRADFLSELGVESMDDIKSAISELDSLKKEQMNELEKLKADLDRLQKELEEEKTAKTKATEAANLRLMRAAVLAEAAKPDHKIHEEAMNDLWAFVDRSLLSIDDEGEVAGAEEAVEAVVSERAYLVKGASSQPGTPLREPNNRTTKADPKSDSRRPVVRF